MSPPKRKEKGSISEEDADTLRSAIHSAKEKDDDESSDAFIDMLERGRPLTDKQRAWAERLAGISPNEPAPTYENLVSSGRVPRGAEVATPLVLQNLPLKPPGRR